MSSSVALRIVEVGGHRYFFTTPIKQELLFVTPERTRERSTRVCRYIKRQIVKGIHPGTSSRRKYKAQYKDGLSPRRWCLL